MWGCGGGGWVINENNDHSTFSTFRFSKFFSYGLLFSALVPLGNFVSLTYYNLL